MRLMLALVFTLGLSCSGPVCACVYPPEGVVLRGTLRSSANVALPGMRVRAHVARGACGLFTAHTQTTTNDAGLMVLPVFGSVSDSLCVRLVASDTTPGAVEKALADTLRVKPTRYPMDTVDVILVLPP